MIYQLINYLIAQPSTSTSPLAVALSNPALLTELGPTVTAVNLVDTRNQEGDPPIVRLYDTGEVQPLQDFIAGPNRIWMETLAMQFECSAYGPTQSIAGIRADHLRLAVEGKIQQVLGSISSGTLQITDLVGSGSTDEIKWARIVAGKPTRPPMGPGEDVDNPQWTVTRVSRLELTVMRKRLKAA
jgi:hypothetical protein